MNQGSMESSMIGNVLNIKQLEALVWVADLGSFRKAAHHLNTTQPNISARISSLEKTLGLSLMLRNAGSISLTDKGREILAMARQVLRDSEEIIDIAQRPDLVTDRLRLGVTELVACTWLHAYLRLIKATFPALNVELTVDLSRNLDVELNANRLDLAIQTAPFASAASGMIELVEVPYIWVASAAMAAELGSARTVADLLPHSVLTHARHTQAYVQFSNYLEERSLSGTQVVSSNSLASCVQMAADGMGVTLLPATLVAKELSAGELVEIAVDWVPAPLRFVTRFQREKAARHLEKVAALSQDVAR